MTKTKTATTNSLALLFRILNILILDLFGTTRFRYSYFVTKKGTSQKKEKKYDWNE